MGRYAKIGQTVENLKQMIKDNGDLKAINVSANVKLTFRQLIQSLKDFEDQHASVMPVAEGAEDPVWGIAYIWFENGVLNLGQYDDEGDSCCGIADEIEKCVPAELLDEVAVVRIGVKEEVDGKKELYNPYGRVSKSHNVKSSIVKAIRDDDWFCKWILKFAN